MESPIIISNFDKDLNELELNSNNPFKVYEKTFNGFKLCDFKFKTLEEKGDIFEIYDIIFNLQFSFYNCDEFVCKKILAEKIISDYENIFDSYIANEIKLFFTKDKYMISENIIKYFQIVINCNCTFNSKNIFNTINDIELKDNGYIEFIRNTSRFVNLINKLDINEEKTFYSDYIISNLSEKITLSLIHLIKVNDFVIFKDFLNSYKFNDIFSGIKIFKYLKMSDKIAFFSESLKKLDDIINDNTFNFTLFSKLLDYFAIFSDLCPNEFIKKTTYKFNNLNIILNYTYASFYFLILQNNIDIISNSLYFLKYVFDDQYTLLESYKYHLEKRSEQHIDFNFENKIYTILEYLFSCTSNDIMLNDIYYCLEDFKLTEYLNSEVKMLTIENNSFKDINIDLSKYNILIKSNMKWNIDNRKYIINCRTINAYSSIFESYFKLKYSKDRKLSIASHESKIEFRLGKSHFSMSFVFYNIFKLISNHNFVTTQFLLNKTNIDENELNNILDIFIKNNIITKKEDKIYINKQIIYDGICINLYQQRKLMFEKKNVKLNKVVDITTLDANITKICKTSSSKLDFDEIKSKLQKRLYNFEFSNSILLERLNRLIKLDIIGNDNEMYYYIL